MSNRPEFTRDGAIAFAAGVILLAVGAVVAIVAGAWQPAAIGLVLSMASIALGEVSEKLRP